MEYFTYLIGAGASANKLPVVNSFTKALEYFYGKVNRINVDGYNEFYTYKDKPNDLKKEYLNNISLLVQQTKNRYSIDTYAKYLYLNNKTSELKKLKAVLSSFLLTYQRIFGIDERYEIFYASILNRLDGKLALPPNINIISWNYDTQFELAYEQYCNSPSQIYSDLQSYPAIDVQSNKIDYAKFSILHLNGSCGIHGSKDNIFRIHQDIQSNHYLDAMIQYSFYIQNIPDTYPLINFAWEENQYSNIFHPQIPRCVANTSVLVVIGYSFPFFNRKIDKLIINSMPNLKKVFIQCPKEDHVSIENRFLAVSDKGIAPTMLDSISQFYIPYEF